MKIISKGACSSWLWSEKKISIGTLILYFFGFCFDLVIILLSFGGPLYQKYKNKKKCFGGPNFDARKS